MFRAPQFTAQELRELESRTCRRPSTSPFASAKRLKKKLNRPFLGKEKGVPGLWYDRCHRQARVLLTTSVRGTLWSTAFIRVDDVAVTTQRQSSVLSFVFLTSTYDDEWSGRQMGTPIRGRVPEATSAAAEETRGCLSPMTLTHRCSASV